MGVRTWLGEWPLFRQATGSDPLGRGAAVESPRTLALTPRTDTADEVVKSVCPYCAVGCGQNVYVRDGRVTQIEGDPDSPISRGRLCPKGSRVNLAGDQPEPASRRSATGARTAPSGRTSTSTRQST